MKATNPKLAAISATLREAGITEDKLEQFLIEHEGACVDGKVLTRVGATADGKGIWQFQKIQ